MALGSESRHKNSGLVEQNLLSLSYGRIISKDINSAEGLLPESFETYQIVEPDDIVFRFTDLQNDKRSLRTARVLERGIITSAYMAFTPRRILPSYFEHLMRAYDLTKVFYGMGGGLRQSLRYEDVRRLPILVPSASEQQAIADFVDRETAKIDALIAKQNEMSALLQERRTAAIVRALTSGLTAQVETRDSGIPHLGSIPAHWKTVPTRYLCKITTGTEDSGNADPDGEYPFYVRGREILRIGHYSFDGEAVMTPGDGQGGTGKVFHYVDGKFEAHQRVYVFLDFKNIMGRYFYLWLSSFLKPVALAGSNTVTMESIRRPLLANFQVAVPPLREQAQILEHLEGTCSDVDALIAKAEEHIALAQERRAALITAAVTGQIDVTGRVA